MRATTRTRTSSTAPTLAAFCLSNSGGLMYGENLKLKKERAALPIELQAQRVDLPGLEPGTCRFTVEVTLFFASPYRADGGGRTHDAWVEVRHVPATPRPRARRRGETSRCRMASLCSCQGADAARVSAHAAARWEGFEPSSPGLEPGILSDWTTTACCLFAGAHLVRHPVGAR
jgi:hypothetical protein